jgi:dihydroorotate dehydrogenase
MLKDLEQGHLLYNRATNSYYLILDIIEKLQHIWEEKDPQNIPYIDNREYLEAGLTKYIKLYNIETKGIIYLNLSSPVVKNNYIPV